MIYAEAIANPADMLGPTLVAVPFPNRIAVEEVTEEHREWLRSRGICDFDETTHRIVIRRQGWIHALLPPVGPREALEHIAARVAGTWGAEL